MRLLSLLVTSPTFASLAVAGKLPCSKPTSSYSTSSTTSSSTSSKSSDPTPSSIFLLRDRAATTNPYVTAFEIDTREPGTSILRGDGSVANGTVFSLDDFGYLIRRSDGDAANQDISGVGSNTLYLDNYGTAALYRRPLCSVSPSNGNLVCQQRDGRSEFQWCSGGGGVLDPKYVALASSIGPGCQAVSFEAASVLN